MSDKIKLMVNFILLVIASALLLLLGPICFFIKAFFGHNKSDYFLDIAYSLDQLGNVICADLLTLTMIKDGGDRFGNPDETISSVLGKNKRGKTLTWCGWILSAILDAIDPNHVIKSIEDDE